MSMEQQTQVMVNLAQWIRERGLESPAILFLQANKPLAPIGGQALLFLQPVLGAVGAMLGWANGERVWTDYAALLENPACIDRLLELLERPA
ncbi:MAG: hypothetical protein JW934_01025 [Anaerolineae bacterium]|nr:hypothetical protein [Anaerolineae bacterium]